MTGLIPIFEKIGGRVAIAGLVWIGAVFGANDVLPASLRNLEDAILLTLVGLFLICLGKTLQPDLQDDEARFAPEQPDQDELDPIMERRVRSLSGVSST